MKSLAKSILFTLPFGRVDESVHFPSYYWDNRKRGDQPYVIFQWASSGEGIFEKNRQRHIVGPGKALPGTGFFFLFGIQSM